MSKKGLETVKLCLRGTSRRKAHGAVAVVIFLISGAGLFGMFAPEPEPRTI